MTAGAAPEDRTASRGGRTTRADPTASRGRRTPPADPTASRGRRTTPADRACGSASAAAPGARRGRRCAPADETGGLAPWLLGLCVCLLFLGGISLDLWRAFGDRRVLAGIVDAAAVAGASAIDEDAYRAGGIVVLDPGAARARALEVVDRHPDAALVIARRADATPQAVTVTATGKVELTLLRVLDLRGPLEIGVRATVEPRRSP